MHMHVYLFVFILPCWAKLKLEPSQTFGPPSTLNTAWWVRRLWVWQANFFLVLLLNFLFYADVFLRYARLLVRADGLLRADRPGSCGN